MADTAETAAALDTVVAHLVALKSSVDELKTTARGIADAINSLTAAVTSLGTAVSPDPCEENGTPDELASALADGVALLGSKVDAVGIAVTSGTADVVNMLDRIRNRI